MSDDLDDLKAAMQAATPAPDADTKAAHLALAQKSFETSQGSRIGARPTSDRPAGGFFRGVANMFTTMSTRGVLTATTALAAVGLIVVMPDWSQVPVPGRATAPTPVSQEMPKPKIETRKQVQSAEADQARARQVPADTLTAEIEEFALADDMDGAAAQTAAPTAKRAAPQTLGALARSDRSMAAPTAPPMAARIAAPSPPDPTFGGVGPDTEAYPDAAPNPLKITAETPVSTFSIDVDTASYAIVRSSLSAGQLPPEGAVRIEEMINYFPYDYAAPDVDGAPFRPTVSVTGTPWNPGTQLVHIAIQGRNPVVETRPPLNLVFLIDTSGSMQSDDKLPLLKQSLALMLSKLGAQDQVAIVAYAGSAGQVLAPTPATDQAAILGALDNLAAGGSTAGQQGLQQAYAVADGMAEEGEVTRVILATDGDFNVGLSDPDRLKTFIAAKRDSGTYLSVMGFGRGNLDDATMQALAQNGNGQAAYIDTLSEAQKVLVDQFTGALFPIANDVKIQVEFNPATVSEYRLIGYETRILRREDFNNDKVDAGDIGAGHSVTALYEVTPVGSPAQLSDPLRYQPSEVTTTSDELGFLKLRYKEPGATTSQLIEIPIREGAEASADMRFATAIAGFGQLLQNSPYLGNWGYDQAISLANSAKGEDAFGYRAEAVRLMRLAQSLSQR
ncbi:MAG: Ca-activated chloride channel family protein [Paracoccaceae bacterium]|jgi:Ca-activated chloride channel family protein